MLLHVAALVLLLRYLARQGRFSPGQRNVIKAALSDVSGFSRANRLALLMDWARADFGSDAAQMETS